VLLAALVDGKNVTTVQQKVCAPSYDVDGVGVGANAGVMWRFGRVAALTARRGEARGHAGWGPWCRGQRARGGDKKGRGEPFLKLWELRRHIRPFMGPELELDGLFFSPGHPCISILCVCCWLKS